MTEHPVPAAEAIPVIMNPTAGGGRLLRKRAEVDRGARAAGVELAWWLTTHPGHATELARDAARQGRPLVLAYGGDGTYNEVARGLLASETALGVLPGGTTSVLAYELGIPRSATRALRALLGGVDRRVRVGATSAGEIFVLMVSAGPDSLVLDRLGPALKRLGGRVGVAVQAVIELCRLAPLPRFVVEVDGERLDCAWVIVGKARSYAGAFHATPGADPCAATLEVVALRGTGRWAALCFALGIPTGGHLTRHDVFRCTTNGPVSLSPHPHVAPIRYQFDGDLAGQVPVDLFVDERSLRIRVPAS